MKTERLTSYDRKKIRSDLTQNVAGLITILLIGSAVFLIGLIVILEAPSEFLDEYRTTVILTYFLIILLTIGFLTYQMVKGPISDLRAKTKYVKSGILTDRKTSENYAWQQNIAAGLASNPKVKEYYLTIGDVTYQVDKSDFDNATIGDQMKVSLTKNRKKFLKIDKEKNGM
jgi:hypothetical protein